MATGDRRPTVTVGRVLRQLRSPTRFGQFFAVGALGALVDNVALVALHGRLGAGLAIAKVASAELAIFVMFLVNEHWTFAGEGADGVVALGRRFVTSNAVRLVGLATGLGVLLGLVHLGVWYLPANVVGLGAGFVVNYCFESLATWQVHRG